MDPGDIGDIGDIGDGNLLLVRHGPGRGRLPRYLQHLLDGVAEVDPVVSGRIRHHETGAPAPDLGGVRVVVFWLGDPLRRAYPGCFAEAQEIANRARERGIAICNSPEALSESDQSLHARRWSEAGFVTPTQHPFSGIGEMRELASRLGFPLLVRSDLAHGQTGMFFCRNRKDLHRLRDEDLVHPCCLAPFLDTRAGFERTDPGSCWARYYHKRRSYILGPLVRNHHIFFAEHPIVGERRSTLADDRRPWWRRTPAWRRDAAVREQCIAEDIAFALGPTQHAGTLRAAMNTVGLQYGAIDYSCDADGRLVLWEANGYFHLMPAPEALCSVRRRTRERWAVHYRSYADSFRALLSAERG